PGIRLGRPCVCRDWWCASRSDDWAGDLACRADRRADGRRRGTHARSRRSRRRCRRSDGVRLMVITFLTDFGLQDDFVGTCHGVIARIAPDARVIDVTHGIGPQAVLEGALVLRNTTRFMPPGVHLAVVDPGVGSERRSVAVATRSGRTFVGPDNGL